MHVGQGVAVIDRVRDLTSDVRELTLRLVEPSELVFSPGQSLSFEVPNPRSPKPAIRYYSLASPPSQRRKLVLLLSASEQGIGPNYLFSRKAGEKIQFGGPDGSFYLHDDRRRDLLFVATGTGIAPFRSMLYTLFERPITKTVTLFWGVRSEKDIYYQNEFQALAQQHPNFSFVIALSRSQKNWTGAKGRVTQLVEKIPRVDDLAVYVCGNKRMVIEVTDIVRHKGQCPVYREKYYDEL
jgi:NAD(P)H-flavin reductase